MDSVTLIHQGIERHKPELDQQTKRGKLFRLKSKRVGDKKMHEWDKKKQTRLTSVGVQSL